VRGRHADRSHRDHPPKSQEGREKWVAAGGQEFEIWPEKLTGIQVGARYDVDVEERDYNGRTIKKITKATPANAQPSLPMVTPRPPRLRMASLSSSPPCSPR